MADGNHYFNTVGHKRGRSDDVPEPESKRQRNEVENDVDKDELHELFVQCFMQFIGDRDMADGYVQLYMSQGPQDVLYANAPQDFDIRNLKSLNPINTMILSRILNGVVPGYTVGHGSDIRLYMQGYVYDLVKKFLVASFPFLQNKPQQNGPQQIHVPPPPFQQALGLIGGNTTNLSSQQLDRTHRVAPDGHPQGLRNTASHSGTIGQQPLTSLKQGQSAHPNTNLVSSIPNPLPLPAAQAMQRLSPQVNRSAPRRPGPTLSPEALIHELARQRRYQELQQQSQRALRLTVGQPQPVVETRSLPVVGSHTQLPRKAQEIKRSSTAAPQSWTVNPGPAGGLPEQRRRGNRVAVLGNGTPGSSLSFPKPEPINKRIISDSAVPHNQQLVQQLLGQDITLPVNNGTETVPRSQTAHGYRTNQIPTALPLAHSFSTSLISPITTHSTGIPNSSSSTPLFDNLLNGSVPDHDTSSTDLGWAQQPQGPSQVAKQAAASQSGTNFTFIMENGHSKNKDIRPQRRAGSSKPKSVTPPKFVPPPVLAEKKEEEEEEEEEAAHQEAMAAPDNGVYNFSIPITLQQNLTRPQQPVNSNFVVGSSNPSGFQQFGTQVQAAPQQQPRDQVQQRVGSGVTTPITPVSISAAVPSSVVHTEPPQPQASTSSASVSSGPIMAYDGPSLSPQDPETESSGYDDPGWDELFGPMFS